MADNDDSTKKLPVASTHKLGMIRNPGGRPARSFITNRDFVPSLVVFLGFTCLVYGAQWLTATNPNMGLIAAVLTLVFMFEWERRARFTFGRLRTRAHFDPLKIVKLPPPMIPPISLEKHPHPPMEMEPPTPYIPPGEEKQRTDSATIIKRAQDTLSGREGGSQTAQTGPQSAMELALINLLKSSVAGAKTEEKEQPSADEQRGSYKPKKE